MSEIYSGTTVKINKNNVNKYKAEISEIIGKTYQDLKILPDEYTQLDYIEATGTQYFDTGYLPKDTSKYEFLGTIVAVPTSPRLGTYLFGENDEGGDENTPESQWYCSSYIRVNRPGSVIFAFGHDEYGNNMQFTLSSILSPTYIGTKHKFALNKESVYIDNELMNTFSETTVPFSKEKSLYLFALHYTDLDGVESAEIGPATIQLNNFKIYEEDILKHDFIPCRRNSDNEVGLYDYVTKVFKIGEGTGTFNAGPVSTLPNEDYQIPSIDYPSDVRACGDNINISPTNINDWEQGTINVNTGGNDKSTTRIRTINYCNIDNINEDYYISLEDENYVFVNIAMFNEDDSFIGPYNTMVDTKINGAKELKVNFSTTNTKKIKVIVRRKDNSNIMPNEIINIKPKLTKSSVKTPWSPYGMGSMEFAKCNKNLVEVEIGGYNQTTGNKETNGTLYRSANFIKINTPNFILSQNQVSTNKTIRIFLYDKDKKYINSAVAYNGLIKIADVNAKYFTFQGSTIIFNNTTEGIQIEEGEVATTPIPHESETYVVSTQEPFYEGDTFVKIDGVRYEKHLWDKLILTGDERNWAIYIQNNIAQFFNKSLIRMSNQDGKCTHFKVTDVPPLYVEEEIMNIYMFKTLEGFGIFLNATDFPTIESFTAKLQELYNSGNPVRILYKPTEPKLIPCTEEQNAVLDELDNIFLYDGTTYIYSNDEIEPDLVVIVKKLIEDYNFYISSDGYLVITDFNIKYLIDLNESNIPIMPEATESSVRAAGRDGDIVLNTTYEPVSFEIVCYTEDNLTQEEKIIAEKNINRFLNSIKNKTIAIAFENNNSFYKVKYNGLLVTTNYPKHLKFTIPLKSSDSYGKDLMQRSIVGNSTGESDTIEDVGAIFIINGPALNPIISLNDYSMEYTTSILEGARVEIDSNKSTIININNDGIKTNVMKYYNHQFPKIQNGTNTLKILSGLDNDKNVSVKWYDLKL